MSKESASYRLAFKIFADFSGTIAVPAVLAALFGKWVDGIYGTEPRYLVIFLFIALLSTARIVWKKAYTYKKQYEDLWTS